MGLFPQLQFINTFPLTYNVYLFNFSLYVKWTLSTIVYHYFIVVKSYFRYANVAVAFR